MKFFLLQTWCSHVLIAKDVLFSFCCCCFYYDFVILVQSLMDCSHSFDCPSCNYVAYVICCFSLFIVLDLFNWFIVLDLFNCHVLMTRGVFVNLICHSLTNYILFIDLV